MSPPMRRPARAKIAAAGLAGLAIWWGGACSPKGPGAPAGIRYRAVDAVPAAHGAAEGFNLLILTLDTTRFDHLACFGHETVKTPRIDGLARSGVACLQAVCSVPMTLPSHSSILTGLYPYRHGGRVNGVFRVGPEVHTLAEVLSEQGYDTAAFIAAFVLDSRYGLDQGFRLYDDDLSTGIQYSPHGFRERPANLVVGSALSWLETWSGEPFFLWVHLFDPHAPYVPPPPFSEEYESEPYVGEIAFVDSQIGVLLDALSEKGALENTLVVLVSDHGEGLGEHGEETHSLLIYDSTVRVPLIFSNPVLFDGPGAIHEQVGTVDIVPTVLDLLAVESPDSLDGTSLLEPPEGRPPHHFVENFATEVLHGWSPLFAVRDGDFKYIQAPQPELYRVSRDPGELHDVLGAETARTAEMRKVLSGHLAKDPHNADVTATVMALDKEAREKLASLGYVFTADREGRSKTADRDPKEMIEQWETVQQALHLQGRGDVNAAFELVKGVVARNPDDAFATGVLASLYSAKGDYETALRLYEKLAKANPDDLNSLGNIGELNVQLGRLNKAKQTYEAMLAISPEAGSAHIGLGFLYMRTLRFDLAERHYREALALDRNRTGEAAYSGLGRLYYLTHQLDRAEAVFDSLLQFNRLSASAMRGLGEIHEARGDLDRAAELYRLATIYRPSSLEAQVNFASILNLQGFAEEAQRRCRRVLQINPNLVSALNLLGMVDMDRGRFDEAADSFRRALEIYPQASLPRINLGHLHLMKGEEDEGCAEFLKVLETDPRNPVAHYNYAFCCSNRGDLEEAARHYRTAVAVLPGYAAAHKSLGSLALRMGNHEEALKSFQRSLELAPHQFEAEKMRYYVSQFLNGELPEL